MATSKAISSKSKGKLTKKELKQDRLVEYTVKFESFYLENKKWVVGVATAVVVIIAAVVVISRSQQSAHLTESYELTLAKMSYGSGSLDDAKQGFEKVATQFSGKTAAEAKLFLARIAFEQGDYSGAEAGFKAYIADYSVDESMDAAACSGLAASLEAQGRQEEALDEYQKLADKYPNVAYAPTSLIQVSRLANKLNQPEKSKQALQRILDKYPDSGEVQQARKELETLG